MALPKDRGDRERGKFRDTPQGGGDTCVAVCTDTGAPLDTTATFSGLKTSFRVTTMTVGTSSTAIPATPLSGRNSLIIENLDENTDTLFIGPTTGVTADRVVGTTAGQEIKPTGSFSTDITDSIIIYGISTATIKIKVTEIA